MGEDGLASGELREPGAYGEVLGLTGVWGRAASGLIGQPTTAGGLDNLAEERRLLQQGLALAGRNGITSVHNMDGNSRLLALYAAMEDLGELTARVYVPLSVTPETPLSGLREAVEMRREANTDMLHAGLVKFFMDGVIESWTAFLLDGYADRRGERGSALYSLEHFTGMAAESDRLGLQITVHAIGDAAVRRTLDGFEAVQRINGKRDSRHRIEHIEIIHAEDAPRFAQLGVIASMQPLHLPGALGEDQVWLGHSGEERWERSFAWQTLRQAGARLVFGSDWPVVPPNPLQALHVALNRKPWLPGLPEQRQTLEQAIASFTRQAAYAEFQDDCKGQLRAGMLADLVMLSEDVEAVPVEEISRIYPIMTVCDGRVVFQA